MKILNMNDHLDEISSIVGRSNCLVDERLLKYFSYDNLREYEVPAIVAFPGNLKEVKKIINFAKRCKIPIVPRGAGTGRTGGASGIKGGIVVSTIRLNKIIDIDEKNRLVITESGVLNGDLQDKLKEFNLFYPPDPASMYISTIGGNIAENAGGPRAVKYGLTSNYLIGIKAITGNGEIIKKDRLLLKDVSSYNLPQFFVSSEGTLGIITESIHRLLNLPDKVFMAVISIKKEKLFENMFYNIIKNNINPMSVEFIDEKISNLLAEKYGFIKRDSYAVLLIEIEGDERDVNSRIQTLKNMVKDCEVYISDQEENVEEIRQMRRNISSFISALYTNKSSFDISVPLDKISKMLLVLKKIEKRYNIDIRSFGHAGDGNLHVNVLYNEKPLLFADIEDGIIRGAIGLGGSITGEHGIGIKNLKYLKYMYSNNDIKILKGIKHHFDQSNIMNPGKKI
jgi:glycolate oxidase